MLTAGGDKLDYPGDPSSPEVSLINVKININSTISRAKNNARYMFIDIKNFYLVNPMKQLQHMFIHKKLIPQEVLNEYDIIFNDRDFTYVEIRRGVYGLKEAGVIAFDQLIQKLKRFGYEPMLQTPGLWRHTSRKPLSHSALTTSASINCQKPTPTT